MKVGKRNIALLPRLQAGDTLVEVLIAIAIVSLVLVSAYASVNKNTQMNQTTQERSQATQLVQAQIEFLRAAKGLPSGSSCFSQAGIATSGSGCDAPQGGASYKLSIVSSTLPGVYTVKAQWTSLSGNVANVTISYKPYEGR